MAIKIKEIVLRYEDDGAETKLNAEEYKKKFAPLTMVVHHHCAPPPNPTQDTARATPISEPKRIEIDPTQQAVHNEVAVNVSKD